MALECNGETQQNAPEKEPFINSNVANSTPSKERKETEETRRRQTDCGWLRFRPAALNCCNSAPWLLALLCCYNLLHGSTCNGLTNVAITSIERRFELSSSRSGLIPPTYDIVAAFVIVVVSFLGSQGSKPRWLASGMLTLSVASIIFTIPHFVTGPYDYGQVGASTDLCPGGHNKTLCSDGDENSISVLSRNLYIFIAAQFLFGLGAPAVYSLGVTFLDESVSTRRAGLYLGIFSACTIIGPAIGFIIGSIFLNFFTDFLTVDTSSLTIDTSSPQWVGAWWLGHLIAAVVMFILVIPLSCLPPELRGTKEIQSKRVSQVFSKPGEEEVTRSKKGSGVKWKHLPRVIKSLFTNYTFIIVTISSASDNIFINGAEVFLPKYLETQFGLTASYAALQTGIYLVLFGGGGLVAAGWAIKRFSLKIPGMLRFCLVTSFICMMGMIGQLLSCKEIPLAGISVSYTTNVSQSMHFSGVSLASECNADCQCSTEQFLPVCGTYNEITYFSPCHAGCSVKDENTNEYHNCSCIEGGFGTKGQPATATSGLCGKQCWQYYTYSVLLAIVMCTLLMNGTLYVNILLRCVLDHTRDYALGIYGFLVRVLGAFAGPILFGRLIDDTCILWHEECEERGRCWVYNRHKISLYMLIIGFCVKAFTVFLFGLAVCTYKPPKSQKEEKIAHIT